MTTTPKVSLHIGGTPRASGSGGTRTHIHPVSGEAMAEIPLAGAAEVEEAVAAAEAASEGWRRTSPEARRDILNRVEADLEYLHGWSLARDIGILLRTFNVLVHHKAF